MSHALRVYQNLSPEVLWIEFIFCLASKLAVLWQLKWSYAEAERNVMLDVVQCV